MPEEPKPEAPWRPSYPGGRRPGELGTHQGGKNAPPHPADRLHGDRPSELPPRYRGG